MVLFVSHQFLMHFYYSHSTTDIYYHHPLRFTHTHTHTFNSGMLKLWSMNPGDRVKGDRVRFT